MGCSKYPLWIRGAEKNYNVWSPKEEIASDWRFWRTSSLLALMSHRQIQWSWRKIIWILRNSWRLHVQLQRWLPVSMTSLVDHSDANTYRNVASRSTCYYSWNQKFYIFKSWLLTCRIFFRNKTFFVFQDRKLKFSASYWFRISWILTKFQLIRTTFIFWSPCYW